MQRYSEYIIYKLIYITILYLKVLLDAEKIENG